MVISKLGISKVPVVLERHKQPQKQWVCRISKNVLARREHLSASSKVVYWTIFQYCGIVIGSSMSSKDIQEHVSVISHNLDQHRKGTLPIDEINLHIVWD